MGVAVGSALISSVQAEIRAFEVYRPPSWIFPFPVCSHSNLMSSNGKPDPENIGIAVEISLISCLGTEIQALEVWRQPFGIFPLPVWSHSISMSPNVKLYPKNIGIAVGISLISCLEAEIQAFEVWRPPFWIFPLPVWSLSLPIGSSGLLDPYYTSLVAVVVEISYLFSLGAELLAFKVLRPPSWIIHFRFGCTVSALVPLEC